MACVLEGVDTLHQGLGKLVENFALGCELDLGPPAFEKHDFQLTLQRLDLQRDRRLGEEQALRRLRNAPRLSRLAERSKLFQTILLVVGGCGSHNALSESMN